jgi:hypothetical protein
MLWPCFIAGTKDRFDGHTHPQQPKKLYPLAWGVVTHPFNAFALSAKPYLGRYGAISTGGSHGCGGCDPVVFCAKATEKFNKTLKLVVWRQFFIYYYVLYNVLQFIWCQL